MTKILTALLALTLAWGAPMSHAQTAATVVEIATFELAEGVSFEDFAAVDDRVEAEHVSQQPGFVSRETGATDTGWVVIVHWETTADAQASMDSFANAPAAQEFMGMINIETMRMTRYDINQ